MVLRFFSMLGVLALVACANNTVDNSAVTESLADSRTAVLVPAGEGNTVDNSTVTEPVTVGRTAVLVPAGENGVVNGWITPKTVFSAFSKDELPSGGAIAPGYYVLQSSLSYFPDIDPQMQVQDDETRARGSIAVSSGVDALDFKMDYQDDGKDTQMDNGTIRYLETNVTLKSLSGTRTFSYTATQNLLKIHFPATITLRTPHSSEEHLGINVRTYERR